MSDEKRDSDIKVTDKRRFRMTPDGKLEDTGADTLSQDTGEKKASVKQETGKKVDEKRDTKEVTFPSKFQELKLPPADFITFISGIASTVLLHLGHIIDPSEPEPEKNLPVAKYHIDILEMLYEKTKGNLSKEEDDYMVDILHDLRLRYVDEVNKKN